MHLLQVCNVGNICGGTAACAWSITRALDGWTHSVLSLSPPTAETAHAFAPVNIEQRSMITRREVLQLKPDVVLLHNTAASRVQTSLGVFTMQYLHSRIEPARADVTVACSQWLRTQFSPEIVDGVLYQPVHGPFAGNGAADDALAGPFTVGRICTPHRKKWPSELIPLYAHWAERHPQVTWEFVGCPADLQVRLHRACRSQAAFWPAEWSARRHLLRWNALLYHHPSLTETFGRTVAEALQASCIPIVDDRGGFREQLERGGGYLCRTMTDFDVALIDLQQAPQHNRLSQRAREIGHARFSGPAFATRFQQLLRTYVEV
ncbi:MAG: glycosyltransferase [Planctomycetaceae bacterium]